MSSGPAPPDPAVLTDLRLQFLTEALSLDLIPPASHHVTLLSAAGGRNAEEFSLRLGAACDALLEGTQEADRVAPLGAGAGKWRASARAAAERLGHTCERAARRERTSKGSYYTPGWLADMVARTALRGVLEGRGCEPEAAVGLRVFDPAAGAGAFMVAMVDALAEAMGEDEAGNSMRRDVVSQCLRGTELDPVAAEACRLALWVVASRPGRPAVVPRQAVVVGDALLAPRRRRGFDIVIGNPPWGVKVSDGQARRARASAAEALGAHRDSFLHFLALAADAVCDDGALGLVLPDQLLWQVKYESMRRFLLRRFRPLHLALLGAGRFAGATAPACALCMIGRERAPRRFKIADLRTSPRTPARISACPALAPSQLAARGKRAEVRTDRGVSWSAPSGAPLTSPHRSFVLPPEWLGRIAARVAAKHRTLGDLESVFRFHDAGINYNTAALGQRILYTGERQHPSDIAVTRGRDFSQLTIPGSSAWLRHDWQRRVSSAGGVSVREDLYRTVPKLLLRQTGDRPIATVDRSGVFFGRSVIAVTGRSQEELLWLAAVMNSATFAALYRTMAPEAGRPFAQVKVSKLRLIPVPETVTDRELSALASKLLAEAGDGRRRELLSRIEERVACAYGLDAQQRRRLSAFVGARATRQGRRAGTS